jgi:hypothetical protein
MRIFLTSKLLVFLMALIFISARQAKGQGIEFGLFLGASNYMGDLSNNGRIVLSATNPSAAIIGRYNMGEKWALKGFFGYGRIAGSDENASKDALKKRNLSFYSDIFEASAHVEFNLVRNGMIYGSKRKLIPYLFTGVGLFNFNPKANLNGTDLELQPLGTEGQGSTTYNDREKYALTQICIPFGIGFKKKISQQLSIGLEFGARYTFTNYLDDVGGVYGDANVIGRSNGEAAKKLSDRSGELTSDGNNVFNDGDLRSNKTSDISDIYFMGGITFTYIFPNAGMRCPKF